jgi:rod shape-determining protein MreD
MEVTARGGRGRGTTSEIGFGRVTAFAAMLILALAVQSTVLAQLTILGVVPNLVLVVVVVLAYLDGERVGVVAGFFGGLLLDLQLEQAIIGLAALLYTLIGYGVATARRLSAKESVWTPVLMVAGASAVAEFGYAGLSIILGREWVGLAITAKRAGLVVLYDTLLTPFVFPLVRRIANRVRPERVYRW